MDISFNDPFKQQGTTFGKMVNDMSALQDSYEECMIRAGNDRLAIQKCQTMANRYNSAAQDQFRNF